MLAHIVGRKTGKLHKQPISYVREGNALLTPGGGKWKLNLDPGTPVRLRSRGRDHTARPELVRDQTEVTRLLDVMSAANPALERFVPLPKDRDGKPDQQALAQAIQHGFRIVRWHLDDTVIAACPPRPDKREHPARRCVYQALTRQGRTVSDFAERLGLPLTAVRTVGGESSSVLPPECIGQGDQDPSVRGRGSPESRTKVQ